MADLTIVCGSHFFKCIKVTPRARPAIESFARQFVQYGFVRMGSKYTRAALKVFAMASADRSEFRFHINCLTKFEQHLEANYIRGDMVEWVQLPIPMPVKVEFKMQPQWVMRDYQTPVVDYIVSNTPPLFKFVDLQTGRGKSACAMKAMTELSIRTLIVVKPMYIEKWVDDMHRTMVMEHEDILVVRGSDQLMALLLLAESGDLAAKVIIISNKTMQNWIKLYKKLMYETLGMGYVCVPEDVCKTLGVGLVLIDEVHQDFFFNFEFSLLTNVYKSLSLSATLVSDDDFMNKMYEIKYPSATRYKGPAYEKYIAATAVIYKLKYPNKMRCKDNVSKNYSHHLFEQSVLRSNELASNYLELIKQVVDGSYLKDYKEGQRCLIFCISIELCTVLTDYLKKCYPKLLVQRYVEEDPWSNLMESDICVSTMQSAGTAVDVDKLSTVIMSTAMSSSQGNIQGFGRLRKMKDGTTPSFLYFVCEDIDSHVKYHEKKRIILESRALTYRSISIGKPI